MSKKEYESKLVSLSFPKPDAYGSLSMPIYNTLAFEFESAEEMEAAFRGDVAEHVYSRITNPTVEHFESRVKLITNSHSVTAFNSGMAAISNAFFTLAWNGSNIVTSSKLFGNTYSFFVNTLAAFGVEVRFCDLTSTSEVASRTDENTCAIFVEIIANPQMEVVDLEALGQIAKQKNTPLVIDSTLIPFTTFQAQNYGVNIDIISSTKYISGGGTSLGGLVIDFGNFDWSNSPKLKTYASANKSAFHFKLRKEIHRNLGAYMTPQAAYMQSLGLETLNIRFEKQANTCLELALALEALPQVKTVHYPGLKNSPYYDISYKQFGERPGAMLVFDLASRKQCFTFLNRLKLIRRATNLFDNRTLIIHPASTIYATLTPEQRVTMDVRETAIRLSLGLEDMQTLLEDIKQALQE